jgi:glycogen debranching enzyme
MSQFTDQAYKLAVEKLLKNASQKGVMASSSLSDGDKPAYPDLYPRDMGVCVIGMLQDDNQELLDLAKLSVESLIVAQSEKGQFPQCFRLAENRAEWWHAGTIDGTLWWSIALLEYVKKTGNRGFLDYLKPNLEKAFTWLTYQDTNNDSLLEQGEAAGWDDEFPRSGTVLYTNALWYWLVRLRVEVEGREDLVELKEKIYDSANTFLWVQKGDDHVIGYLDNLRYVKDNYFAKRIMEWVNAQAVVLPYYLGYVSHLGFEMRMDVYGNILACISGLADEKKSRLITDYIFRAGINKPFPVKVLYPPIYPGEQDWKPYMTKGRQNYPWQYHNAGIWPFVGGFWVMWLGRNNDSRAAEELENLAKAAEIYNWEFNEYLHGQHGTPMGIANQSWSMAMYIGAYKNVKS